MLRRITAVYNTRAPERINLYFPLSIGLHLEFFKTFTQITLKPDSVYPLVGATCMLYIRFQIAE